MPHYEWPPPNAITLWQGITTAAGNAGGTTIVDTNLGAAVQVQPGQTLVIYTNIPNLKEAREILSYAGGTTTVNRAFSAQVPTGVAYEIMSILSVDDRVGGNNADNAYSSPLVLANPDGSLFERLEAILQKQQSLAPALLEFWQDEAGIDATVWATAVGGTGTAARDATEAGYLKVLLNLVAAGGGDTSRLRSIQRYPAVPAQYGINTIARRLILEFEARITTAASRFDNTVTIIGGLTSGIADTRATANIIAFILNGDALATLTDSGGVETLNAVGGVTLTAWNKYRIEVSAARVKFYVNESTLLTAHTTNLPNISAYLQFYGVNDAGGADGLHIGKVRCWIDDEAYAGA